MNEDLGKLFQEITAGWVLSVPIEKEKGGVARAVVLRTEGEGEKLVIWLSLFSDDEFSTTPICSSPYCWDSEKKAIVDCRDEVPEWFRSRWTLEREGGEEIVKKYESIPRLEHLLGDSKMLTFQHLEDFMGDVSSSSLATQVVGVLQNSEAGELPTQLALILEALGVEATLERIGALSYVIAFIHLEYQEEMASLPCFVPCFVKISSSDERDERIEEGHSVH